jgi:hypothetical protein
MLTLSIEQRRHILGFEAEGRRSLVQAGTRRRINHAAEIIFGGCKNSDFGDVLGVKTSHAVAGGFREPLTEGQAGRHWGNNPSGFAVLSATTCNLSDPAPTGACNTYQRESH